MGLDTYKTVTFKDRLMQALEQIRAVERKIEEGIRKHPIDEGFLEQCIEELRDAENTLLTLHKEVLFYISE